MIGKITKGNGFAGVCSYILNKDEARLIGGNMASTTPRQLAAEFRVFSHKNQRVQLPVEHISLSPSLLDRELDDTEWHALAIDLLDGLGMSRHQYIVVLHSDTEFEGNAQGFRILTRSERQAGRKSLQLTFATLATFTKYPRESLIKDKILLKQRKRESVKYKESEVNKYGFFQSEKEIFKEVAEKTGLIPLGKNDSAWWCRHPLAFLVEAADDICYRIMDLEDGFNMGYIDYHITKKLLVNIAGSQYEEKLISGNSQYELRENIRFLRGKAINKLIDVAANKFIDKEEGLLTGEFDESLLHGVEDEIKEIKKEIKAKVYNCQEVLSIEIAGYDVISALLDEFMTAINDNISSRDSRNKKGEKVNKLLP